MALLDGEGELLSLDVGDLELEFGGLTGSITTGKGASAIWGGADDFGEGAQLGEALGVTEGDEDDTVVSEEGEGGEGSGLDSSVLGGCAHEDTSEFSVVATCCI
eukprot:Phypoly_transcript_16571.p2 GENE.Phypoly_transcript_16571~~Phypoly_transcript_16571.p2  ORF type:complete len:119 (-),score=19.47 Phypoly_transcript_16571:500-811(-)